MLRALRAGFVLVAMVGLFPAVGESCTHCRKLGRNFCDACNQPAASCCCPPSGPPTLLPPMVSQTVIQTTVQPVAETHYRPQKIVTCRDVCETRIKKELYTECVPVQTCENIMVDEGCYQWVPKMVCKQIPKTVMAQRVACRDVPYQVQYKVPQVSTVCIPYQTMKYYTSRQCFQATPAAPNCAAPAPNCAMPGGASGPAVPQAPPAPPADNSAANSAFNPNLLGMSGGLVPQPDPTFDSLASRYDADPIRPIRARVNPQAVVTGVAGADGRYFQPAPSAAAVWRAQR